MKKKNIIIIDFLIIIILMGCLVVKQWDWLVVAICIVLIIMVVIITIIAINEIYNNQKLLGKLERLLREELDPNEDQIITPQLTSQDILSEIESRLQMTSLTEALKTEAELHALQNQINPHFLYNTLEIIRSRAMVHGSTDVAEMVEALALQFRYCINNSGETATLEQELENVHNYLLIQRYRYGDRFSYREIISNDKGSLMSNQMPIMTLQPLIENALVHGINPRIEGGIITLRITTSKQRLHIAIEDDGVGISEHELHIVRQALQKNKDVEYKKIKQNQTLGIAMKNVNQRIRFYFGSEYGVDIISTRGVGTSVNVTLPLLDSER